MILAQDVLGELIELAKAQPHLEVCGLLTGSQPDMIDGQIPYQGPLQAQSFRLPDQWLLEQCYRLRSESRAVRGYYHSHPGQSLKLSPRDRAGHPLGSLVLVLNAQGHWAAYRSSLPQPDFQPSELALV